MFQLDLKYLDGTLDIIKDEVCIIETHLHTNIHNSPSEECQLCTGLVGGHFFLLFPSTLSALASIFDSWALEMCPAATPLGANRLAAIAWALSGIGYDRPGPAKVEEGSLLRALDVSLAIR